MFNDHPQIAPEGYAWVCDKCQVAAFRTLDEAERHEKSCDNIHIPTNKSTDWESLPAQSTNNQGGNILSYTQGGDTEQESKAYSDNSMLWMTILCPSVTKTAVDSKGPSFLNNNNKDDCMGDHKISSSNGNKSDDTDTNTDKTEDSFEAIKQSILGLGLSMYNIDHKILSKNTIRPVKSLSTSPNENENNTMVVYNLCQDLSCPICHNRLTNPASLLCGHSFCMTCLDWWLNFQQQQQHQYQQCSSGMSGRGDNNINKNGRDCTSFSCLVTCPLCGEPILTTSSNNRGGECKPKVQVNTALKAALENLYGSEMDQHHGQSEHHQKIQGQEHREKIKRQKPREFDSCFVAGSKDSFQKDEVSEMGSNDEEGCEDTKSEIEGGTR